MSMEIFQAEFLACQLYYLLSLRKSANDFFLKRLLKNPLISKIDKKIFFITVSICMNCSG